MRLHWMPAFVLAACLGAVVGVAQGPVQSPPTAPVLPGSIGGFHHPIRTSQPEVQRLFDQGMTLYYGFNRDGARRTFQRAARLDPGAAMPQVGLALALGPNINMPATPEERQAACVAGRAAAGRSRQPDERAYAEALVIRYCAPTSTETALHYANAMGALHVRFTDDPDAATLYADSLMALRPRTREQNAELLAVLESALARWPDHVGANHLYIHLVEGSRTPERALSSARRLETLAPAIGHLLHMPSHIDMRVGDYGRSMEGNVLAAAADSAYLRANPSDHGQTMYYEHDLESLAVAAGFAGSLAQAQKAGEAAASFAAAIPSPPLGERVRGRGAGGPTPAFSPTLVFALLRFLRWQEVLKVPAPAPQDRPSWLWYHFARGVAHAGLGELPQALSEQAALDKAIQSVPKDAIYRGNPAPAVLAVYQAALEARLAHGLKDSTRALAAWERAVSGQDQLEYHEPPPFYYPARESLGAALYAAGRYQEAERVFREDLTRHPANGRSLFGLWQTLAAVGRAKEAATAQQAFVKAWRHADIKLSMSAY